VATLQGLDRGLQALAAVSARPDGLSVADLAAEIGIDRAVAYRIVETLEQHGLVVRTEGRRYRLGAGVIALAERFHPQLLHAASPVLQELADATRAAAFLTVEHDELEGVPVAGAEARAASEAVHVGYRIGVRHALDRGANGLAILALRPPVEGEPAEVARARERGYASTSGHLQPGASGIAAGFVAPGPLAASIGVVAMGELDEERVAGLVRAAARRLAELSRT
jgi:Transcriptional regulator